MPVQIIDAAASIICGLRVRISSFVAFSLGVLVVTNELFVDPGCGFLEEDSGSMLGSAR